MQNNHNTDKKSASELLEEFEQKYNELGSKEVNLTKMQNSDTGMQEQVTEENTAHDSISFGASGVGISLDSEGVDPITESIRKEILQKQREQLRLYFSIAYFTKVFTWWYSLMWHIIRHPSNLVSIA